MPILSTVGAAVSPMWLACLVGLLLMAGIVGWRWATVFGGGLGARTVFALMAGLHVPALVVLLPVPFSVWTNLAVAIVLYAASYAVRVEATKERDSRLWFALAGALCLAGLLFQLGPDLRTHYDYYLNSNLLSLDLARSGSTASTFAVAHDLHNWVLTQLTTTVALDAFEMQVLGSNTNLLPRLLQLILILACLSILSRLSKVGSLAFAMLGAAIIFEQSIQFRPHIFVGLFVLLSCLISLEMRKPHAGLVLSAVFLAFSKRDGLLLAPFVFVLSRLRPNLWLLLGATAVFLVGALLVRVGGRSPLLPLIQGLASLDVLQRAASKVVDPGILVSIAAATLLAIRARTLANASAVYRCCVMLGVLILLVIGGSMVLGGAGFWNLGTDDRKVLYIVLPVTVGLLAASWPWFVSGGRLLFLSYLLLGGAAGSWASFQLLSAAGESSGWANAAVANTSYLRKLVPDWQRVKIGVLDESGQDLAPSVLGDLDLYKFQFLVAYDGADLVISDGIEALSDRDVIFVPPAAMSHMAVPDGYQWARPYGVYAALVNEQSESTLLSGSLVRTIDGSPFHLPALRQLIQPFDEETIEATGTEISATTYPSGETNLVFSFGAQSPRLVGATIKTEASVGFLTFRDPLSGVPPQAVLVDVDGHRREYLLEDIKHYDTYYVPVPDAREFDVAFLPRSGATGMGIMALGAYVTGPQ